MTRQFHCDFHIHSTLSPCASLEMSPRSIVRKAKEVGLDIIALTDHNMIDNGPYASKLGREADLMVLFGMELQTREEIHLLILFGSYEAALDFQKQVYALLPDIENDSEHFGDQVIVDENDVIVRFEKRLLLNSVDIELEEAVARAKGLGGLVIPSHIDSPTFSIISQLGFVPDTIPFDALEVRNRENLPTLLLSIPSGRIPFVSFSDAHYLDDIGRRRTLLQVDGPDFASVVTALHRLAEQPVSVIRQPHEGREDR